ncbi:hypothetical protein ACQ4PT_039108 [Festuca glaucescens]
MSSSRLKGSALRGGATSADDEQRQGRGGGRTAYGGVSKRAKMAEPTTIVGCSVFQFRVDYEQNKKLPIGEAVHSDVVSVGGHLWRVECFVRGYDEADNGEYISIFFSHTSQSRSVRAIVEAFMIVSKRAKMAEPDARITNLGSSVFQFRVHYDQSKQLSIGDCVHSDVVSAGGHLWRIEFFPRGNTAEDNGKYASIFLRHMSKSCSVKAIFDAFMMGRDGKPSTTFNVHRVCETFEILGDKECSDSWGCPIPVPPSDIGTHLGRLLDHTDGTDVSFIIDGETFPAHRAVLAARSPVFRAELFGSMAEATMSSIKLYDITPATFRAMLRFIYTDELLAEDKPEDTSIEMIQNLLAAADLYALDRLKFICAQKLWDKVSADTVATILSCAETYNCHELKNKCIDFFVLEENFKQAVFTDGYAGLVIKFPSVAAELKKRVRA